MPKEPPVLDDATAAKAAGSNPERTEPPSEPPRVEEPPRAEAAVACAIDEPPLLEDATRVRATEIVQSPADDGEPETNEKKRRWYAWPFWCVGRMWDFASLMVLLAVVSALPLVQFAGLGYLLHAAGNLADRKPWRSSFPGLRRAGRMGTFCLLALLSWLPVWFVTDLSYSAQLLQPDSRTAVGWRVAAFLISGAWVVHVAWAAMRGGRWWHFLWPAPLRFVKQIWRPRTWGSASDALYEFAAALEFPRLWWLGARAAAGALLLIIVPVSCMVIGLRAYDFDAAGLVGLFGAVLMSMLMLYLPFLQIQLASTNQFSSLFDVRSVRRRFRYAPLAHAFSLLALCLLCLPLYLLRIEATPAQLLWAPSLVFVMFMLPAKLLLGAAMGYAAGRAAKPEPSIRHWTLRWPARVIALASVAVYVGALFVAQLVASQGAYVMYLQHAFLVPAPLISS